MRVVTIVAMVELSRDFGPYRLIFINVFATLDFPVILDG
jgi:hypothetical protein